MNIVATVLLATTLTAQVAQGTLEVLQEQFVNLYESLRATGGMTEADKAVVDQLRQRLVEYNRVNPDVASALAMELQLSEWLEDDDRVNQLFGELTRVTDDVEFGVAWAGYFERRKDPARVGAIYDRLGRMFPDDAAVQIGRAGFFRNVNQYDRALEALEAVEIDPAEQPQALVTLSECQFAEHRFEEAVATLESIPQETLATSPTLARQVELALEQRKPYPELWAAEEAIRSAEAAAGDLPRLQIITSRGPITVELFENEAPNTVANFISLAESGFYEGTTFHRVIPNFMAQGGDPNTKPDAEGVPGQGSPGYRIADEHDRDDARKHFKGSLSMAKETAPHTGGSQFFITHLPTAHLNGLHTVFGRVVDGLDVARSIEADDVIEGVIVISKRDHEYTPETLPDERAATPPATLEGARSTQPDLGTTKQPNLGTTPQ